MCTQEGWLLCKMLSSVFEPYSAPLAEYVEDRMGLTITSIWRLMVKDIEDTLDSTCDQVPERCQVISSNPRPFLYLNTGLLGSLQYKVDLQSVKY